MATLGDLAKEVDDDNAAIVTDQANIENLQASLNAAQTTLTTASAKLVDDEKTLGTALAVTGGFFRVNTDGTATAYEPDGSGGVKITVLKPDSTPVP